MDKNPLISIIIPVYNSEKYLNRCINSILNQSYRNIELLLINDGSTDNSLSICKSYLKIDKRINIINLSNGGVSKARNIGISAAKGDYIMFIDSDDEVIPSYINDFGDLSSNFDLALQGITKIQNDLSKKYLIDLPICANNQDIIVEAEKNNILNSPVSKLFKRSIILINSLNFDETLSYGEDHLFTLNYILYVNKIIYSNKCGYLYYTSNQGSLTKNKHDISKLLKYTKNAYNISLSLSEIHQIDKNIFKITFTNNFIRILVDLKLTNLNEFIFNYRICHIFLKNNNFIIFHSAAGFFRNILLYFASVKNIYLSSLLTYSMLFVRKSLKIYETK